MIGKVRYILGILAAAVVMAACALPAAAQVRYAQPSDTVRAKEILTGLRVVPGLDTGKLVALGAGALTGAEAGEPVDNDSIATVCVSFGPFDDLGFVNAAMALAKGAESQLGRWQDYGDALVSVSRRRGVDKGFSSRMIYGADWVNDNVYRGNLTDLTERYSASNIFKTKSLDGVTFNRSRYRALADSATYEAVRMVEMGFRSHKIPHLKKETINKKEILGDMRDGDILMLLGSDPRFDIYDMGVVVLRADGPHIIHVSETEGKVVEEPEPLPRWFKRENQHFYGYRWLRVQ